MFTRRLRAAKIISRCDVHASGQEVCTYTQLYTEPEHLAANEAQSSGVNRQKCKVTIDTKSPAGGEERRGKSTDVQAGVKAKATM